MKKIITIFGIFGLTLIQAQVGINTDAPKATLDMRKNQSLDENTPQGVIFPKFTTAERTKFTGVDIGTMIYNTSKKCVEIYTGIQAGVANWNCVTGGTSGTGSSLSQDISVDPDGFEGRYNNGVAMTNANRVKFILRNKSSKAFNNLDLSGAVTVQNGTPNIQIVAGQNASVNLAVGASVTLYYTITGTPVKGLLTANFDQLGLDARQSVRVGSGASGTATSIPDKTVYVVSLVSGQTVVQGKINNGNEKLFIDIPYTGGSGAYDAVTVTTTTAPGHDDDKNGLTLNIPSGNFGASGELNASITVDGDGEYLVKRLAPGAEYNIATFRVTMSNNTFNVVIKGIGGIKDRKYGDGAHNFIYLPVEVKGGYANGQPYRRTWLNMNLGADYAKVGSADFNPTIKKSGNAAYNDKKLYGSSFQWQRSSDGHELKNAPEYTAGKASSWTATGPWTGKVIKTAESWVNFYTNNHDNPYNTNINDTLLWRAGGATNPCPVGYHVPSNEEWGDFHEAVTTDRLQSTDTDFFKQTMLYNLPATEETNGTYFSGIGGIYWTSSTPISSPPYVTIPNYAIYLNFGTSSRGDNSPGGGSNLNVDHPLAITETHSVRCIKD